MLSSNDETPRDIFKGIRPQEIELGTVDIANCGVRVDGIYFYKNTTNSPNFMSVDILSCSLYKVIADYYPILAGHLKLNIKGKAVISVDPDNLCIPDFREIHVDHPAESFFITRPSKESSKDDCLSFFNLHKFYRASGIGRLPYATYYRDNAAVVIRILRFKDSPYVALTYSISHVVFDATSTISFIKHWAEYSRNFNNPEHKITLPPEHNRDVMHKCFETVEPNEPSFIKHFRETAVPLNIQSPENIAPILLSAPDMLPFEEQHLLHISGTNLERMRHDTDSSQTTIMVLTAALTKAMVQANTKALNRTPKTAYVAVAYDGRQRSGVPQNFSGNTSFICVTPLSFKSVLEDSNKALAHKIKESCLKTDSSYSKAYIEVVEKELGLLYHSGALLGNNIQSSYILLSYLRHLPFNALDFGYGAPNILSFDYFSKEGMCRVYPNYKDDGIDLFINYWDAHFEHLRKDQFLAKYVDFIY
ncbi:hypothetical protein GGI25_003420 [Coemansia spiralis]|uniref:Uncharacterized protein n=2 Tax=Coemansia TaxID=4863 RepID=A0A9W8G6F3_9FUNG|nr:transferase family-domain-containing protein [Coemansia spiralis]KAJ1994236.1 hypothetical protein EDC05_001678 [Coemansia umbellata]KAJ2621228.1 hypothetical protein GGI26_004301 [Coemansia sp. RSA 1358]KAJ2676775.1 hypothetical protein GGI25_003420 [Coemansia spiralis]